MHSLLSTDNQQNTFEQHINERLGDFDIISLLRLLKSEGIKENSVWFTSHNSIASQNRVIESIKVVNDNAFIEVNIGILAPTGILPGYMRQFMDRADVDDNSLQNFFKLFDHLLILSYLTQLYPEVNRSFFDDWQQTKQCYVQLQNMRGECSLHWLFETAFPEFTVHLTRLNYATKPSKTPSDLGSLALGAVSKKTTAALQRDSFKVYLTLRPELISTAFNWPQVVKTRLEDWIFPLLNAFSMYLEVYLCTSLFGTHLKLFERSALGYDPFYQSDNDTQSNKAHQWRQTNLIYADKIPLSAPNQKQPIVWEDSWRISL